MKLVLILPKNPKMHAAASKSIELRIAYSKEFSFSLENERFFRKNKRIRALGPRCYIQLSRAKGQLSQVLRGDLQFYRKQAAGVLGKQEIQLEWTTRGNCQ